MRRAPFRRRQLQTHLGRVRRDERVDAFFHSGVTLRIQNNRIAAVPIKAPLEAPLVGHRGPARGPLVRVERAPLERRAEARVAGLALVLCQLRRLFLGTCLLYTSDAADE